MFGIVLILQFLIRLRFPAHRSVSDVIITIIIIIIIFIIIIIIIIYILKFYVPVGWLVGLSGFHAPTKGPIRTVYMSKEPSGPRN